MLMFQEFLIQTERHGYQYIKDAYMDNEDNKFTWGDSVYTVKNAPKKFHPGEFASVCGFYRIQSQETAQEFLCDIGSWLYTVEFEDGSDIQVAECFLEKFEA